MNTTTTHPTLSIDAKKGAIMMWRLRCIARDIHRMMTPITEDNLDQYRSIIRRIAVAGSVYFREIGGTPAYLTETIGLDTRDEEVCACEMADGSRVALVLASVHRDVTNGDDPYYITVNGQPQLDRGLPRPCHRRGLRRALR